MNIFKTFALKWWQAGVFKLGMLALGIAIGTYWREVFGAYLLILITVAVVSLAVSFREACVRPSARPDSGCGRGVYCTYWPVETSGDTKAKRILDRPDGR